MNSDTVRESFVGQLIYYASGRRIFRYDEDMPDFVLPEKYAKLVNRPRDSEVAPDSEASTLAPRGSMSTALDNDQPEQSRRKSMSEKSQAHVQTIETPSADEDDGDARTSDVDVARTKQTMGPFTTGAADPEKGNIAQVEQRRVEEEQENPYIVDWYGPNDPENPRNWSLAKRCFVTFDIALLTFSIYIGSAIYAPGIEDISQKFGISTVAASLGITLFVLGYGVGPMFLSPLSEIPQFGRTSVYIISLFIFVILQIPTALSKNLGALLPLRSLQALRMESSGYWPVGCRGCLWTCPWPVIGGFAVQAEGWTWTIWILCWLSGVTFVFLAFFLPETSSQSLLYRRAARLRRLTGEPRFKSMAEIEGEDMTVGEIAQMTLVSLSSLASKNHCCFWNVYISLVYGILYIFIESFNVVFVEIHGFNLAQNGLAFLGLIVGTIITYGFFVVYAIRILKPKFANGVENFVPEERLPVAIVGGILLPISLFMFGWTSFASIPWIVPIIASGIFSSGAFLLFQAGLNYLPDCYPRYVASILAGNDLFRSTVGAAFPVFSTAFFHNLGVGPACSILGGAAILMLPFPFILYKYGARIRKHSKFAN
ncbi:major facilitator superfamily domain-containing protein [Irpex lacteus]|nr:major facilitator superfamily domain-containing protein [Irpex lacteus]